MLVERREEAAGSSASVAEKVIGLRTEGTAAAPSPTVTTGSRPISSAKATPWSIVLIGPHGTPAPMISRNQSIFGRVRSRSTSSGRSWSRLAVRSSLRAKRGSSGSSGRPSTSHSRRNCPSLPAVTISSPSAQGSGSYGNRLGWLLPIRNGTTPPATNADCLVHQPGQGRGQQVHLDVLAETGLVAVVQRGEHADGRVQTGHDVEERDTGPVRLAVGLPREAHESGDRLHDQVVARERRAAGAAAEAADRRVDDAGVAAATLS